MTVTVNRYVDCEDAEKVAVSAIHEAYDLGFREGRQAALKEIKAKLYATELRKRGFDEHLVDKTKSNLG